MILSESTLIIMYTLRQNIDARPAILALIVLNLKKISHLKLCRNAMTHSFKWLKIADMYLFDTKHLQSFMVKHSFHSQ